MVSGQTLAIKNMFRVLKKNGILYMSIPDKRYSFDIKRPITSYQHLVEDYTKGSEISKKEHFEEWVKLVCNVTDDYEVTRQVNELMITDYSIHFHVWTQVEMIELVLNIKKKLEFEVELICRNIGEMIFVLRKS
jgi:predicted SAM-dependent methyltransferase